MEPAPELKTETYLALYYILQAADLAEYSWGGKKMFVEMYQRFLKMIEDDDRELAMYLDVAQKNRDACDELDLCDHDTVADINRKCLKLLKLQMDIDVNVLNMKRMVRNADRLDELSTSWYL